MFLYACLLPSVMRLRQSKMILFITYFFKATNDTHLYMVLWVQLIYTMLCILIAYREFLSSKTFEAWLFTHDAVLENMNML